MVTTRTFSTIKNFAGREMSGNKKFWGNKNCFRSESLLLIFGLLSCELILLIGVLGFFSMSKSRI